MIAAVITWIAKTFGLLLIVVALIVARVKVRQHLVAGRLGDAIYILWGELLFYVVGIGYAYTGLLRAAAAAQHIQQILCCHNYAPGNAGWILWIGDIAIPIVVLACALASAGRPRNYTETEGTRRST